MVGDEAETAVGAEGRGATGFGDVVGAVQAVQVHRGVAQAGENLGRGAGAYSAAVLVEGDVAPNGRWM